MKILVTAGNTQVPIDRVRCITSIFSGRTGANLALHAHQRGHHVTLLTSHPEVVADLAARAGIPVPETDGDPRWRCFFFQTFDQLEALLKQHVADASQDTIIASAAVSDYRPTGIFAPSSGTYFSQETGRWSAEAGLPTLQDRAAGKVKSDEPELWLRLARTPKLIDRMHSDWGFRGRLVKFKLEVGSDRQQLLAAAEASRLQSAADFMVANLYDGTLSSFLVGPVLPHGKSLEESYQRVPRQDLPHKLFDLLESGKGGMASRAP
jgi:phosphopantothenate---cysteine ligase (CTP)